MCLNPRYARIIEKSDGSKVIKFKVDNYDLDIGNYDVTIPCGKCPECLVEYSKEWAFRIMCEAEYHVESCFVTLTYAVNPTSLVKSDLQKFLKRLRRKLEPLRIKFFACGEYGSHGKRPHYHAIIFGWKPKDLTFVKKTKKGSIVFTSKMLEDIWSYGFVSVGDISLYDAFYCAKYMQKLNDVPEDFVQPFTTMSKGLGFQYMVDNAEVLQETDQIWFNGDKFHIPRYFMRKAESELGLDFSYVKAMRQRKRELIYFNQQALDEKIEKYESWFGKKVVTYES